MICINTTVIVIDHIGFLKPALLESHKKCYDWTLTSPLRQQSRRTHLPQGFVWNACKFWYIPWVLELPKMSWGSFLPYSGKVTFIPYLKGCHEPCKLTRYQAISPWGVISFKVSFYSLNPFADIQSLGMCFSNMTFSQTLG